MKKKRRTASKATKKTARKPATRRKVTTRLTARHATRSIGLPDWLEEVRSHAEQAAAAGSPAGACLVANPQTGAYDCILTDQASCAKLGGTFVGGPCGPS